MRYQTEPLLTRKELAYELRKHSNYVTAMRTLGFKMPGKVARLSDAIKWLEENEHRIVLHTERSRTGVRYSRKYIEQMGI